MRSTRGGRGATGCMIALLTCTLTSRAEPTPPAATPQSLPPSPTPTVDPAPPTITPPTPAPTITPPTPPPTTAGPITHSPAGSNAPGPAAPPPNVAPTENLAPSPTPTRPEPVAYQLIPTAFAFELGWGGVWLKDSATQRLGLGHGDLFMVGLGGVLYDLVAIYGDLGLGSFADDRSFSQNTTAGRMESSASAIFASISAGVRTPRLILHKWFALTAGADVGAATIGVTRKIENCVDCSTDDVSMRAGTYYDFRLAGGPASRGPKDWSHIRLAGVGVTYRRSSSASDFDQTLLITIGVY